MSIQSIFDEGNKMFRDGIMLHLNMKYNNPNYPTLVSMRLTCENLKYKQDQRERRNLIINGKMEGRWDFFALPSFNGLKLLRP